MQSRGVPPHRGPTANATVVARGDTDRLADVATARTNASGVATLTVEPTLGANQADGTVAFAVKPPTGSEFVDRRENTQLLVLRE